MAVVNLLQRNKKNRFVVAFCSTYFMARLVREQKLYDKYKLQEKCVLPFLQLGVVFFVFTSALSSRSLTRHCIV